MYIPANTPSNIMILKEKLLDASKQTSMLYNSFTKIDNTIYSQYILSFEAHLRTY